MILNYLESFISNFINLHSIGQRIIIIKFHKIKTRRCVLSISNEKQRSEQRWSLRVSCFTYFRDVLALQYTTYLLYRELWKMLLHPQMKDRKYSGPNGNRSSRCFEKISRHIFYRRTQSCLFLSRELMPVDSIHYRDDQFNLIILQQELYCYTYPLPSRLTFQKNFQ